MKFYLLVFALVLTLSCSKEPASNNAEKENIKAKNKETAVKNEVSAITRDAQKFEKQGRGMEIFRQAGNAENMRECSAAMEEGHAQIKNLDTRVKNLPDIYNKPLAPITADLYECVSCSKTAMESCVKARASINKAIKEIYPQ